MWAIQDKEKAMNKLDLIQTPNRRRDRKDRRGYGDRRLYSGREANIVDSIASLSELLQQAHDRIRTLERAVESLQKTI